MAYPSIRYNGNTLDFTYPNVGKPESPDTGAGDDQEATRHDTVTCDGTKQSIIERIDVFKTLQMDDVPELDLPAWRAFTTYALQGFPFDYYPDSSLGTFSTWTLEDDKWLPKRNVRG